MNPEANGKAFLGLVRHFKAEYGQERLSRIVADAGPQTGEVFSSRIRKPAWYPYEAFTGLLQAADLALGRGDGTFCRELGRITANVDLNTIYRVYLRMASPERLIRGCTSIWKRYYRNAGTMKALSWSPEQTVVRISDFPTMSKLHCRLMEGWMRTTLEIIGLQVSADARETHCMSKGAAYHEFACSWQKKSKR